MWSLSFPPRDRTHAPSLEGSPLTTGPPRKSLHIFMVTTSGSGTRQALFLGRRRPGFWLPDTKLEACSRWAKGDWEWSGWASWGDSLSGRGPHVWLICLHMQMPACEPSRFSRVWLFVTLWTVALQAPLSMGFCRQEYQSGSPCPSWWNLPTRDWTGNSCIAGRFFTTDSPGKPFYINAFSFNL